MPREDTQFKPGQSGNPAGCRPDPPELKAVRLMTKKELAEIGNLIVTGRVEKLKQILTNPKEKAIRVMIASVALRIISKGDTHALDVLLNRLIGKVKDEVHHSGKLESGPQVVVTIPANGSESYES